MAEHTPGPWRVVEAEYAQIITASLPRGEVLVAEVRRAWDSGDPNARLIAAAPELLAAAKRYVDDYLEPMSRGVPEEGEGGDHEFWAIYHETTAAIAKAERREP